VFGPQKGADPAMVQRLDAGLAHYAALLARDVGTEVLSLPGGGAAGGLGAGAVAFLGSQLQSGITTVLDTVGFEEEIRDADLIFTGEGKLDSQSLRGKVVCGVAKRAQALNVPVIAEGVETEEQLRALKTMGCDLVQGYYFSRPLPAQEYEQFVKEKVEQGIEETPEKENRRKRPDSERSFDRGRKHDNNSLHVKLPRCRRIYPARIRIHNR
jgi:glycerate kinase